MSSDRQVVSIRRGNSPVIEVHGHMDETAAQMVLQAVRMLVDEGCADLAIDFTAAHYAGQSWLSTLIDVHRSVEGTPGCVRLTFPPSELLLDLQNAAWADRFEIEKIDFHGLSLAEWRKASFCVSGRMDSVSAIRHNVAKLLMTMEFTPEQMEDVMLAVGEAASNAVRYGSPYCEIDHIFVECNRTGTSFTICITDEGPGFDPCSRQDVSMSSLMEGGRGLILMRLLMDEVNFTFCGGTSVHMVKHMSACDGGKTGVETRGAASASKCYFRSSAG